MVVKYKQTIGAWVEKLLTVQLMKTAVHDVSVHSSGMTKSLLENIK
jgi:hypothetical protein